MYSQFVPGDQDGLLCVIFRVRPNFRLTLLSPLCGVLSKLLSGLV